MPSAPSASHPKPSSEHTLLEQTAEFSKASDGDACRSNYPHTPPQLNAARESQDCPAVTRNMICGGKSAREKSMGRNENKKTWL